MTSFKLNVGQKMLRFRKVTLTKVKFGELFLTSTTLDFHGLFMNKFYSKLSKLEANIFFFLKEFIAKSMKRVFLSLPV